MKKKLVLAAMCGVVLALGMGLVGCGDDGGGGGSLINPGGDGSTPGDGGSTGVEKSIRVTGLGDFIGEDYELGIATSYDNLENMNLIAYAAGRITNATVTAALYDYQSDEPWTGTGSYYVGVSTSYGEFASESRISFTGAVTTVPINSFAT